MTKLIFYFIFLISINTCLFAVSDKLGVTFPLTGAKFKNKFVQIVENLSENDVDLSDFQANKALSNKLTRTMFVIMSHVPEQRIVDACVPHFKNPVTVTECTKYTYQITKCMNNQVDRPESKVEECLFISYKNVIYYNSQTSASYIAFNELEVYYVYIYYRAILQEFIEIPALKSYYKNKAEYDEAFLYILMNNTKNYPPNVDAIHQFLNGGAGSDVSKIFDSMFQLVKATFILTQTYNERLKSIWTVNGFLKSLPQTKLSKLNTFISMLPFRKISILSRSFNNMMLKDVLSTTSQMSKNNNKNKMVEFIEMYKIKWLSILDSISQGKFQLFTTLIGNTIIYSLDDLIADINYVHKNGQSVADKSVINMRGFMVDENTKSLNINTGQHTKPTSSSTNKNEYSLAIPIEFITTGLAEFCVVALPVCSALFLLLVLKDAIIVAMTKVNNE